MTENPSLSHLEEPLLIQFKDNPQLTQLKADARAFDEAHGINEEIDVSKIEF